MSQEDQSNKERAINFRDQDANPSLLMKHRTPVIPTIFFTILTTLAIIVGFLAVFHEKKNLQEYKTIEQAEPTQKDKLRHMAEQFNFSGVQDVVDADVIDKGIKSYLDFQRYVEEVTAKKKGYSHSIFDIIGLQVKTSEGQKLGTIEDILVHRWSRQAEALILKDRGGFVLKNLGLFHLHENMKKAVNKKDVITLDGDLKNLADHSRKAEEEDWISLNRLRNGDIIDFEGHFVGKVKAVVYGNDEVQGLYFDLCSTLKQLEDKPLYIPFNVLQFIEHAGKLNVMLTKEQTYSLARCLLTKE